ncbi:hypothetical protein [Erwinia sp. JH02]|uniref:hypothetical protein n=1 Tax=Erwinia sp. JH02 TaxID=2733394 RepID=UPI001487EB2F|nr:hypothetical protein [Erwinia sp. JH02]NNS07295.1 hypothetical protein [Erwinia sp. JH02]
MTDTTDIAVLEIKPEQAPSLYVANGLDNYLEQIRALAKEVPDVTTKKGRDRIGSLARMVGSSKKAIEEPGRNYLRQLKEAVKPAEEELRRFTRECDLIRDEILAPRDEWDVEQERIKEAEAARLAAEEYSNMRDDADRMNADFDSARAEALRKQFESDHEIALLLNEKFDRDAIEAKAEAERQRISHEEEIARLAVERARQEAEAQSQRERQQHQDALSEISGIQQQVIIAQSGRSGVRKGGTTQCIKDTLAETEAWPIDDRFGALRGAAENAKYQAIEQIKRLLINAETIEEQQKELAAAEQNKQQAIADEQRKAQDEANRIKRETEQKEAARLAEDKRIADEAAKRAANEAHRRAVGTDVVKGLVEHAGLTREQAIATLKALMSNSIPHTSINY